MNMKKILLTLILILTYSCNDSLVTETEINAVQKVLNFYDCECERSKGFESVNGIEKTFFELEISKSKLLEHDFSNINSHAGNIAYLFYSNLEQEKSNYDEIKVKINSENGKSNEFKYSDQELKEIESYQSEIKKINELIISKNYNDLIKEFESSIAVDKNAIEELFNLLNKRHGNLLKNQFQGFQFAEVNNNH